MFKPLYYGLVLLSLLGILPLPDAYAANSPPVASNQTLSGAEDSTFSINLGATDANKDALTYQIVSQPLKGKITAQQGNKITYKPNADFVGTDRFTFTAKDASLTSNTATVSLTVTAVNDAPIATARSLSSAEDTAIAITLAATDIDSSTLNYRITTLPQNGKLSATNSRTLTYTPNLNFNGQDSFSFVANDGSLDSAPAPVSLTLKPVNDPPIATPQTVQTLKNQAIAITLSGTDVDGDSLGYFISTQPSKGKVSALQGNTLTYTPNANVIGTDTLQFRAKDATNSSNPATVTINITDTLTGRLLVTEPLANNAARAIQGQSYTSQASTSTLGSVLQTAAQLLNLSSTSPTATGTTNANGEFTYKAGDTLSLTLAGNKLSLPAKAQVTQQDLAAALCQSASNVTQCTYTAATNLTRLFLNTDTDKLSSNGIQLLPDYANFNLTLTDGIDSFELALGKRLALLDRVLQPIFQASLGINLEAPQPEADEVGGQPVPFADVFRIARPFKEYSCPDITYDSNGWPTSIPASCKTQTNSLKQNATTILFRYLPNNSIPNGKYTVLYEGKGTLSYYGIASKITAESTTGRDVLNLQAQPVGSVLYNTGLRVYIIATDPTNPIRNIRIVMPGGICANNPTIRVEDANGCAPGKYQSFVDTLATNRNAIVFNPDYLRVLKDFRTVRMMNFMEASPRKDACPSADPAKTTCLLQERTWAQRAKMDDAMWGGSYLTPALQRYGVPLEVMVALANQLNINPWFTIPHNANDDYVTNFATYVRDNLKPSLKAHIEYSNEAWNGDYLAGLYVRNRGLALSLGTSEYWAGTYYYAKRAVEIFKLWEQVFNNNRLVRILGTQQAVEAEYASRNMLAYADTKDHVDGLALAPYFWGCRHREAGTNVKCQNTVTVPRVLAEAKTLDDIFSVIDNENDPYALGAALQMMQTHGKVAAEFDKALLAYEGGQHLTTNVPLGSTITTAQKTDLTKLFADANRDPRMGERYARLLNAWKNLDKTQIRVKQGTTTVTKSLNVQTFMLYTLPQSFHPWGNFGLKEGLLQARSSAPKYDAALQFQESQAKCWWNGC
jgi:hypothetical protein